MTGSRPLVVAVTDLVRRPGVRRPLHREVVLENLAITTASIDPAASTVLDLEVEAISNGVVAAGTITVPWFGACRRCLEDVHSTTTVDVREVFERQPTEGETYPLANETVDLEPMVRDIVLLTLPLAPLCTTECLGPAPEVFPATVEDDVVPTGTASAGVEEDDEDGGPPPDPRWAALDQLKFE